MESMQKKLSLKKEVEKSPPKQFVTTINKSLKTPIVRLKYCYLAKPFYYPGSHIGRYSITLLFNKSIKADDKFLTELEKIATKEGVTQLGYLDNGDISLKFQTKEKPVLFSIESGKETPNRIELDHDVPEGFKASVEFELNTYYNKSTQKKAFNFCPKIITFHLDDESEEQPENEPNKVKRNGNNKSRISRPRSKNVGIRNSKLQSGKKRSLGEQLRDNKNPSKTKGS